MNQKNEIKEKSEPEILRVSQLYFHKTDNVVRPIIGNKEIENVKDPAVEKDSLPFQYVKIEDIIDNLESEFVQDIFENIFLFLCFYQ